MFFKQKNTLTNIPNNFKAGVKGLYPCELYIMIELKGLIWLKKKKLRGY